MPGLTYDAGALIAAERGQDDVWVLHNHAVDRGQRPTVPAGVLAQVWRGGPQARLSRLLKACDIEALDESLGREAGLACGSRARRTWSTRSSSSVPPAGAMSS